MPCNAYRVYYVVKCDIRQTHMLSPTNKYGHIENHVITPKVDLHACIKPTGPQVSWRPFMGCARAIQNMVYLLFLQVCNFYVDEMTIEYAYEPHISTMMCNPLSSTNVMPKLKSTSSHNSFTRRISFSLLLVNLHQNIVECGT